MKKLLKNIVINKDNDGNFVINKKGITLIALVITIVVLIILASVIIGIAIGQNGLINRTKQAKEDYLVKANEEQVELAKVGTLESTRDGASANPTGTIISYMGNNAPTGYLKCDGTEYNISDYQGLADQIKTEFGSYNNFGGNGTTTFKVPNLQGEFLRGAGTNVYQYGGSGANVGVHQPPTIFEGNRVDGSKNVVFGYNTGSTSQTYSKTNADVNNISNSAVGANSTTFYSFPYSQALESLSYTSRPTNTSVLYCIKY